MTPGIITTEFMVGGSEFFFWITKGGGIENISVDEFFAD